MNRFAAGRMRRIEQSGIRRMLEKAMALERSGREVIHMEIGRTDFDTPAVVKEEAKRALDEGLFITPLPWACWSYGRLSPKNFGRKTGSR